MTEMLLELATISANLVKEAPGEFEKIKCLIEQANLLVKHGELANAEYLLESTQYVV